MNQPRSLTPPKRLAALLLAACLFVVSSAMDLQAAERRGAMIQVDKKDGSRIAGELLQIQEGSLRILDGSKDAQLVVAANDVRSLKIVKQSKAFAGVGIGLLGGALLGAGVGALTPNSGGGWWNPSPSQLAAMGAVGLGVLGAAVGGIVGAIKGADEFISCEGRTPKELSAVLTKLERYAKYPAGAAVAATIPSVQKPDVAADQISQPPAGPSDSTATAAEAGPAADTTPASRRLRRIHIDLGLNYVSSAGVGTLKDVMRSVGFDHQDKSCFWGLCNTADYPRVWKDTALVSDVRIDYSLNSKWAVGLAYSPIGSHRVAGREEIPNVDYRPTYPPVTELATEYSGQTLAATASLLPIPDAFLKKDTVRASLGVGVSRIKTSLGGGPDAGPPSDGLAYHLDGRELTKTAPAILVSADWIHFFNRTLSFNVGVQYRYIPFSLGPQTISAAYYYYPASPPQGTMTWDALSVAIPKRTVNAGGIGFGMGFGFHW